MLRSFFIFFFLGLIITFVSHKIEFFEYEVYANYAKSMLLDWDFNILNQYPDWNAKWIMTEGLYHPDDHSPLISMVIIPFTLVLSLFPFGDVDLILWNSFAYLQICTLLFSLYLIKREFDEKYFFSYIILFFCSPAIYFFLFDPSEISFFGSFFTLLFLVFLKRVIKKEDIPKGLIFLTAFSGIAIKNDLILYALFLGIIAIWLRNKQLIIELLLAGISVVIVMALINYNRYHIFTFHHSFETFAGYLGKHFFAKHLSPSGVFLRLPLFLPAIAGIIIGALKRKPIFIFAMACLTVVCLYESIMPYPDTVTGRTFQQIIPLLALGLANILPKMSSRKMILIGLPISLFGLFYSLHFFLFIGSDQDMLAKNFFSSLMSIFENKQTFSNYLDTQFYGFKPVSVLYCFYLSLFSSFLYEVVIKKKNIMYLYAFPVLTLAFVCSDFHFGKKNKTQLRRDHFFQEISIGKGDILYYDEFRELIQLQHKAASKNPERQEDLIGYWESYIKNIQSEKIDFTESGKEKLSKTRYIK